MFLGALSSVSPMSAVANNLNLGIFDQDVSAEYALAVPQLYMAGIKQTRFTIRRFLLYVLDAVYQSVICFYAGYFLFNQVESKTGQAVDHQIFGTGVAMFVIVSVNLFVGTNIRNWTWMVFVAVFVSFVGFFAYVAVYAQFKVSAAHRVERRMFGSGAFWIGLVAVAIMCLLPRLTLRAWYTTFWPSDLDIIRERQKYGLGPPTMLRKPRGFSIHASTKSAIVEATIPLKRDGDGASLRRRSSGAGIRESAFGLPGVILEEGDESDAALKAHSAERTSYVSVIKGSSAEGLPVPRSRPSGVNRPRPISAPPTSLLPLTITKGLHNRGLSVGARNFPDFANYSVGAMYTSDVGDIDSLSVRSHGSLILMNNHMVLTNTGYAFATDESCDTHDVVAGFSTAGVADMAARRASIREINPNFASNWDDRSIANAAATSRRSLPNAALDVRSWTHENTDGK